MQILLLLLWLKGKLMLRGYRRSPAATVGVVISLLIFLPLSVFLGWVFAILWTTEALPTAAHLLALVLLGIYALWLIAPLLGYSLNDSYDITRLFVYPITVRQIYVGAVAGSVMDVPVLFVVPILVAAAASFWRDSVVSLLAILIALALFLFHTLSLSQTIVIGSAGALKNRRYRELATLAVALFWVVYYVAWQSLMRHAGSVNWVALVDSPAWNYLTWLPPGLTGRAVSAAATGSYGTYVICLAVLALYAGLTIYGAAWVLERVYVGDEVSPMRRSDNARSERRARKAAPARPERWSVLLPSAIGAVVEKEFRYLARDPYFKVVLMNLVYAFFVAFFAILNSSHSNVMAARVAAVWGSSAILLLMQMQLVCNIFGTEGAGSVMLFLTPVPRRDVLLGKNLAMFLALTCIDAVFVVAIGYSSGVVAVIPLLFCWLELAQFVFLAVGNLTSIYFPYRVVMRGWRIRQQSASRGCGYTFIYLGLMLVVGVVLLPVGAAMAAPILWYSPSWLALTLPLAGLYCAGLYVASVFIAVRLLREKEPDIIARVTAEET